jgi:hypothetical protein
MELLIIFSSYAGYCSEVFYRWYNVTLVYLLPETSIDLMDMTLRRKNGSAVGVALTALLFNKHTNAQLERIIKGL